ncbi:MAG: sporulation protein YabP [Clostridiaceae bacterium]|jgi:sporulation protein YabP|nr:sporulation protein YabP [Clostridiaceae bacterium]
MEENCKGNVLIEDRLKLTVTGVIDVDCFDNENVILITELGTLIVSGSNFRINRLNVDIGEIIIEGEISGLVYSDGYSRKSKGSFLSKMFK